MCGRFAQYADPSMVADLFDIPKANIRVADFRPRYNVAPSQPIMAVRLTSSEARELVYLRWGLLPFWTKDPKRLPNLINARAETVADKPAFRQVFRHRRCLIPADGFYEWKPQAKAKQPYRITRQDAQPFALAGLWDAWENEGHTLESCALLITEANPLIRPIHDRMPVILPPQAWQSWLNPKTDLAELKAHLTPYPPDDLTAYPISLRVNNPRNDDPQVIAEMAGSESSSA